MQALPDLLNPPFAVLPAKLEPEHLLSLLPSLGYQAVIGADAVASSPSEQRPLYFVHEQVIVLPPSTDNPLNSPSKLNGIEANVTRAMSVDGSLLRDKDLILFPVYEEWQPRMSLSARKHWVLLAYVKADNTIYLLDSMGRNRGENFYGSNLKYLDEAAKKALRSLDYVIDQPLKKMYLDRQSINDTVSGGYWVSYLMYRFNQGMDLAGLQHEVSTKTLQDIKADLIQVRENMANALVEGDGSSKHGADPDPSHISPTLIEVVDPEQFERQNYAQPAGPNVQNQPSNQAASSLLLSPTTVASNSVAGQRLVPESHTPPFWSRFKLDFYSILIYAGAASALLALLCLASTTPFVSATVSTGVLGFGMVMVVSGILGKCGIFPTFQSGSSHPTQPSVQNSNVLV